MAEGHVQRLSSPGWALVRERNSHREAAEPPGEPVSAPLHGLHPVMAPTRKSVILVRQLLTASALSCQHPSSLLLPAFLTAP